MPAPRRVLFIARYWEERFLAGIAAHAREAGWILHSALRRVRNEIPSNWTGDGVIANTLGDPGLLDFIGSLKVPVVVSDTYGETLGAPMVYNDELEVGKAAAAHLLELGFKHFGFVGPRSHLGSARAVGFETALAAAGMRPHGLAVEDLALRLAGLPRPMGLMAVNDVYALEAMHHIESAGFAVPRDFALVGVDDDEITCTLCSVPLTSVNLDFEGRGHYCGLLLDELMSGGTAPSSRIIRPIRGVTVRKSTDTIAIPHPMAAEALRFIRERYREPVALADLEKHLGVSLRGIQEIFRRHVGRSLAAEISRLRVAAALDLLKKQPKLKLEAIAGECGFSGRVHLARAIRREAGISPQALRRGIRHTGKDG